MSNGIKVKKRNGRGTEALNLEKMHKMVDEATQGLAGVSASQVEIQSGIQFYDGITTAEIQEILIKSASDLIDLEHPSYPSYPYTFWFLQQPSPLFQHNNPLC